MARLIEVLLAQAQDHLNDAQDELAAAEISLVEATARQSAANAAVVQLKAAVAALSGSPPPAAPASKPPQKQQVAEPDNPLARLKCSGCGTEGSLREQFTQSSGGSPVRMLVCSKCSNQSF